MQQKKVIKHCCCFIKSRCKSKYKNVIDRTPLSEAVFIDNVEITKTLLENNANPDQRTRLNTSLFSYANLFAYDNESQIAIAKLLDAAGASHIPLGQDFMIDRMKAINIEEEGTGVCFGIICMAIQSFFAGKLNDFLKRIELIESIPKEEFEKYINTLKNDHLKLVERAKKNICEKLAKEYGLTLSPDNLWSVKIILRTNIPFISSININVF